MIDVEFFPFDIQICYITLFSISYNIHELRLNYSNLADAANQEGLNTNKSDEWDILNMIANLKAVSNIYQRDEFFHGLFILISFPLLVISIPH